MISLSFQPKRLLVFSLTFLLASLISCLSSAQNTLQVSGRVIDGENPVPETRVALFKRVWDGSNRQRFVNIGESRTSDDGHFSVTLDSSHLELDRASAVLHLALDSDQNVIGGLVHYFDASQDVELPKPIELIKFIEQELTVTDQLGKPIDKAVFETSGFGKVPFLTFRSNRGRQPPNEFIELPGEFRETVQSDKNGIIKIKRVPENGYLTATITLPNGTRFWIATAPGAQDLELDFSSRIIGKIQSIESSFDPAHATLSSYCTTEFLSNYAIRGEVEIAVDEEGKVDISNVPPGTWSFYVASKDDRFYATSSRFSLQVVKGETATIPDVEFLPGIPIRGKVLAADTEKGIRDVGIHLSTTLQNSRRPLASFSGKTDENGEFFAYVPPGNVRILYSQIPVEFCAPRDGEHEVVQIDTTTGESSYEFPPVKFRTATTVVGNTVDQNGNGVSGASIQVLSNSNHSGGPPPVVYSNSDGEFEIPGVDPADFIVLRAKAGEAVSKGGIVVDPEENNGQVDLVLSEDQAFSIKGQVVDKSGNPVPGISINLRTSISYVSRFSNGMGLGTSAGSLTTDEDGRFQTTALYDGDRYRLTISYQGYADYNSTEVTGRAGSVHDFGSIPLVRTNVRAAGRIVDSRGEPIPGVTIFNSGDAPTKVSTVSNDEGIFELNGLPDRPLFLFATAEDYRFCSFYAESLDGPLDLTLLRQTETREDDRLAPYTHDDRKELCKYMLRQLLALPPDKRQPIDFLILRCMARVDPDAAMQLISDPAHIRYRQDVTIEVARSIIDEATDEAIAMIHVADSGSYFNRVLNTAIRLSQHSPETATRLAENLATRLEKIDPPNKIYCIAQLGKLLTELGHDEAGQKYFLEAFGEASKLSGNERESFVMGFTAEQIANWDLDRAFKLVDLMKQTPGTSKTRHLGNIAAMIAESQPDKAVEILKEQAETRRDAPRVAYHLAKNSVDHAEHVYRLLIESGQAKEAVDVLLAIAQATAETNPQYAFQSIDQIFEIAMRHDQDFESWSNFGYEAPLVGMATVSAAAASHPDISALIAKALASRRGTSQTREEIYTLKSTVRLAKYLAMADRRASLQLLNQLQERKSLLGGGGYATFGTDEWLMAWSLTDAEKAKQIFDELLQEESKNDVFNQNDLTRVLMYLSESDEEFLRQLTRSDALWYPGRE